MTIHLTEDQYKAYQTLMALPEEIRLNIANSLLPEGNHIISTKNIQTIQNAQNAFFGEIDASMKRSDVMIDEALEGIKRLQGMINKNKA